MDVTELDVEMLKLIRSKESDILECLFQESLARPDVYNKLEDRMQISKLFHDVLKDFVPEICSNVASGEPFDCTYKGARISVKTLKDNEIIRRPYKRGRGTTKPGEIQLKNTKNTDFISNTEADYLWVFSQANMSHALLSWSQVAKLLPNSRRWTKCNENGFDKKGQIKLFIPHRSDCLYYGEMSENMKQNLWKKYRPHSAEDSVYLNRRYREMLSEYHQECMARTLR